jgi:glycosyltransferase domain-containing protein
MQNQLTIILFILERQDFTLRFLRYFNNFRFPYSLIIGDGSKLEINKEIEIEINKNKNIIYKKFKNEYDIKLNKYNYNKYFVRQLECIKIVKTKYFKFISDDDFFLESSLIKMINFLNKETKFIAAGGPLIDFQINAHTYYGNISNLRYNYFFKKNFDSNSKEKRLELFMSQYHHIFHYLCRTEIFLKIFLNSVNFSKDDDFFKDMYHHLSCILYGKIKRFKTPMLMHQVHNDPHDGASREKTNLSKMQDVNFFSKLEKLNDTIINKFNLNDKSLVKKLYYKYILVESIKNEKIYNPDFFSFNQIFFVLVRKIYNKLKIKNGKKNNFEFFINQINNSKIKSEIIKIKDFLKKY